MVKLSVHMVNVIDRDGLGTLKLDFWVPGISQKKGLRQVKHDFSTFLAKFLAYLVIFKSSAAPLMCSTLKNRQNIAKNEENPCSTCVLTNFSH